MIVILQKLSIQLNFYFITVFECYLRIHELDSLPIRWKHMTFCTDLFLSLINYNFLWDFFFKQAFFRIILLAIFWYLVNLKVIFFGMVCQLNTTLGYLNSFDKYVVHERKAVGHFVFMFPFCAKAKQSYPLVRTELTEHGTERVHCVHVLIVLQFKDK